MNRVAEPFVHVLLFQCPTCGNPVTSAIATSERNPEETDVRSFILNCPCGWKGNQPGILAKGHWVMIWG